jgi:predicted nucleotidyltransferase
MDQTSVLQLLSDYKRTRGPHHGIRSLGIFGSMARDQAAPASDVDIVVQLETPDPYTLVHIREELEAVLHLPVDIVRYRERMNPFLKARIDREGKYVG